MDTVASGWLEHHTTCHMSRSSLKGLIAVKYCFLSRDQAQLAVGSKLALAAEERFQACQKVLPCAHLPKASLLTYTFWFPGLVHI